MTTDLPMKIYANSKALFNFVSSFLTIKYFSNALFSLTVDDLWTSFQIKSQKSVQKYI